MEPLSLSYLEVAVDDAFLVTVLHGRHNLETGKTDTTGLGPDWLKDIT